MREVTIRRSLTAARRRKHRRGATSAAHARSVMCALYRNARPRQQVDCAVRTTMERARSSTQPIEHLGVWPPNYVLLVSIFNTTQSFEGRQFPDFTLPELSFLITLSIVMSVTKCLMHSKTNFQLKRSGFAIKNLFSHCR